MSPSWAWFDGRIIPFSEARVPIEDRGLQFGESLYEVVAVVAGSPWRLEEHVERMALFADELDLAGGLPGLETWRRIVTDLHRREPHRTALLYAQLTGGTAPRRHLPAARRRPLFFAYLQPHRFPMPADVSRGIAAVTVPEVRWARCDVKTTMLLGSVLAKHEAAESGAEEALFVGQDGYVNEGASSTVFIVRRRAVLTPPPSRRILAGVSAHEVREVCASLGIAFEEHFLTLSDLKSADEVFLASTTTLVQPVVTLDRRPVGPGAPGPLTLQVAYHFQRRFWGPLG